MLKKLDSSKSISSIPPSRPKLKNGILLVKVDFDSLENHISAAIVEKNIRVFIDDDKKTAHGKISKYIDKMSKEARYTGYDGRIYPIYELRPITVE